MTGVEAVSNGVRAFREPATKNARITLSVIIGILVMLLAGIAYLSSVFQIGATTPGQPGYESVLSSSPLPLQVRSEAPQRWQTRCPPAASQVTSSRRHRLT